MGRGTEIELPTKPSDTITGAVNFSSDESESIRKRSEPSSWQDLTTSSGQTIRVIFGSRTRRASGC